MLLTDCMSALQAYVRCRIDNRSDVEDIVQDVCEAAWRSGASAPKELTAYKAWLIGIASHKCSDYYRRKQKPVALPKPPERDAAASAVHAALAELERADRELLYLHYFADMDIASLSERLRIPQGTVKSRLHRARQRFRAHYPYQTTIKGEIHMKKMPDRIPDYTITPLAGAPFAVKWEEMMGWFIVPRVGEKLSWAMYDFPERKRTEVCEMEVIGKAEVHGIEGVEIRSVEYSPMDCNSAGGQETVERHFAAQLTDTHCRYLAESHIEQGVKKYYTFLDGSAFLDNWGFGENNCGKETDLVCRGTITQTAEGRFTSGGKEVMDVPGRYEVVIGGKRYDTVCVMDVMTYDDGIVSMQYIDKDGRTVLWRRFNPDDWKKEKYGGKWSELLPDNERIYVNGKLYVHWYDCITDHIL